MNGGEDEPGSRKDRVLLEICRTWSSEGVCPGPFAIGAAKAYLYINANFMRPRSKASNDALSESKGVRLVLGSKDSCSSYDLDIEIVAAPHNYVAAKKPQCSKVIEGKKPQPRQKPPFPSPSDCSVNQPSVNMSRPSPTCPHLLKGADWYRSFGTKDCPAPCCFAQ